MSTRLARCVRILAATALAILAVLGVSLAWMLHAARVQREVVEYVKKAGGDVHYDRQIRSEQFEQGPARRWAEKVFGMDFVATVLEVGLTRKATDADLAQVARLSRLKTLYLAHSKVTDQGLASISNLKRLEVLYLADCRVTDMGLARLSGLVNLRELTLDGARITDSGLARLSPLKKLEMLFLYKTPISDAGLVHLKNLSQLRELNLDYTNVSDAGVKDLEGLKKLEFVSLVDTKATDAGVKELRKSLPNARVSFHVLRLTSPWWMSSWR